jgi:hypothetical protein
MKEREEIKMILAIMETDSYSYVNVKGKSVITVGENKIKVRAVSFEKAYLINNIMRESTKLDKVLKMMDELKYER